MNRIDQLAKISVIAIAIILGFAALSVTESIVAPTLLAMIAGVVLSPLTDFWEDRGYPPAVGALLGLVGTLATLAALALVFQPVVARLVEEAPKVWSDMQGAVRMARDLARGISDVTGDVSAAIGEDGNAGGAQAGMALPGVADALLFAPTIMSQTLIFAGALFFFLLTRRDIYNWAARRLSDRGERAETALRLREAERRVSRYFMTITLINAALGTITAITLEALGLPDGVMWGILAFLLNYVVYLGPAIFVAALLFAGIAAFDGAYAVLPAAAYVTLNSIEGQFVTPALVGRHLELNPLVVFLALIFGIWLWGPIGGVVAIPLVLWVMVLNDGLGPRHDPTKTLIDEAREASESASNDA